MQATGSLNVSNTSKFLLVCGSIAGPLFTTAWFLLGLVREHYDPMQHPISALAIGGSGWMQSANFMVTGLLTLMLAFGLHTRFQGNAGWGPLLIGAVAFGYLGDGFFVTDPLNGFPPGTPPVTVPPSLSGSLHLLFASVTFFGLLAACFELARYFSSQVDLTWAAYSKVTAVALLVTYLFASAGFLQVQALVPYAGLIQRISLTIGMLWLTLLPIRLLSAASIKK
jgi:hypothetical protein